LRPISNSEASGPSNPDLLHACHLHAKNFQDPRENLVEALGFLALLVSDVSGQTLSFDSTSALALKTVNRCVSSLFMGLLLWPFVKRIKSKLSKMQWKK
jgi:hypothetical protein